VIDNSWRYIILIINYLPQMFKKLVVVDAKGHLLGRLASYIAKALLSGTLFPIQAKE
jgi:ribosomal protein L13